MTLAAVVTLVRDRIGLDPASLGSATLSRAVDTRARARDAATADDYAGLLAADPGEWTALVGELVVPETWFFRGGRAFFAHLARHVREVAAGRPTGVPVRVLSAPCSTGEEPYSLVMALDAEGVLPAQYQLDAVDLARDHLLRAVTAHYPAFAFREAGPDPRPRYFRVAEGGRWELHHGLRERVRFRPGNLVQPDFLATEPPYDLILCRNLFIYLTDDGRARALTNLDRLLAPDGRLCLTPAEADRLPADRFVADGPASLSTFRRATGVAKGPQPGVGQRAERSAAGSGLTPMPLGDVVGLRYNHVPLPAPPAAVSPLPHPVASTDTPADPLQIGRELADAGRLEEARVVCEQALAVSPLAAELFSLLGVVHLAAGRRDEARDAFRKALYLDPGHAEALTHLSVLCARQGDPDQAERLRRQLARAERGARA